MPAFLGAHLLLLNRWRAQHITAYSVLGEWFNWRLREKRYSILLCPLAAQRLARSKHFLEKLENALVENIPMWIYIENSWNWPQMVSSGFMKTLPKAALRSRHLVSSTLQLVHRAAAFRGKDVKHNRWMTCFPDHKGCSELELLVTVSKGSHSFPLDFEIFPVMADFLKPLRTILSTRIRVIILFINVKCLHRVRVVWSILLRWISYILSVGLRGWVRVDIKRSRELDV